MPLARTRREPSAPQRALLRLAAAWRRGAPLTGGALGFTAAPVQAAELAGPAPEAATSLLLLAVGALIALTGAALAARRNAPAKAGTPEARLFQEQLLDAAPDALVVVNASGRVLYANRRLEDLLGYRAEEVVGRPVETLLPERFRAGHVGLRQDYFRTGEHRGMHQRPTLHVSTKDGRDMPVQIALSKVETGTGSVYAAAIRDATDRKAIESELLRSQESLEQRVHELQSIRHHMERQAAEAVDMAESLSETKRLLFDAVESISEGFALWDAQDKLLMCNDRYRNLYPALVDLIVPGVAFTTMIRAAFERGIFVPPEGDLEESIRARLQQHRTSAEAFEERLADGRWVRVNKRRTKAGHIVGIVSEITDRVETDAKIRRLALEDSLTGLPNRTQFQAKLGDAVAQAERTGLYVGLMLLDLDHFKQVNDTLGHPAGDALLCEVAKRLLDCTRKTDTVVRLGGDEFAVIVTNARSVDCVVRLAERFLRALTKPFMFEDHEIITSTSIGIAIHSEGPGDGNELLRFADLALYRAKEDGRSTWRIYDEKMSIAVEQRRNLERDLYRAVERKDFHVVYQPRIDIRTGRVVAAEALLRWSHPERGDVSPGEFIPVAESAGLIVPITRWLFEVVSRQNRRWQRLGLPPIVVSINLSPLHLKDPDLVGDLTRALRKSRLEAKWLELEITESTAMTGGAETLDTVFKLKAVGVKLSIDDFGTGYSSLDRLRRFPVDCLKIDQSFVRDITSDENDAAICAAAIRLSHGLGISVLAEGVETEDQLEFLIEQGCDEAQGYYFSRPLSVADMQAFLEGSLERDWQAEAAPEASAAQPSRRSA